MSEGEAMKDWSLTSLKEKLIKDRREGRQPWALHRLPDGGGSNPEQPLRRHPAADRGAAAAAGHVDSVMAATVESGQLRTDRRVHRIAPLPSRIHCSHVPRLL